MSFETETVLDRRRLRRRISLWRTIAIIGVAFAIFGVALGGDKLAELSGQQQIARVAIDGTIFEDRLQLEMLKKIEEADHVAALLVYINSPGGTTTGGEALFDAIRKVAKKKPVVAQFGTVAASAGYILGLSADHIVSRGNTITGSVGVLVQWPQLEGLMDKIGVKFNTVRSGEQKARPNFFEPTTDETRKITQEMIDESFQWFLGLVKDRRRLNAVEMAALKDGRTFSGREAIKLRLVDEIGGEAEAVRWLETKRNVTKDLKVITWDKEAESSFGLTGSMSAFIQSAFGREAGHMARLIAREGTMRGIGLDGLLSLWHPSEN